MMVLVLFDYFPELGDSLIETTSFCEDYADQIESKRVGFGAFIEVLLKIIKGRVRVSQRIMQ